MKRKLQQHFCKEQSYGVLAPTPDLVELSPLQLLAKPPHRRTQENNLRVIRYLFELPGFFASLLALKDSKYREALSACARFFQVKRYPTGYIMTKAAEPPRGLQILLSGSAALFQADDEDLGSLRGSRLVKLTEKQLMRQLAQFLSKRQHGGKLTAQECVSLLKRLGIVFQLHRLQFSRFLVRGDKLDGVNAWKVAPLNKSTTVCCQECVVLWLSEEVYREATYQIQRKKHSLHYQLLRRGIFQGCEERLINKFIKDQKTIVLAKGQFVPRSHSATFVILSGECSVVTFKDSISTLSRSRSKVNSRAAICCYGPGQALGLGYFGLAIHQIEYVASSFELQLLELDQTLLGTQLPEDQYYYTRVRDKLRHQYQFISALLKGRQAQSARQQKELHSQHMLQSLDKRIDLSLFRNTRMRKIRSIHEGLKRNCDLTRRKQLQLETEVSLLPNSRIQNYRRQSEMRRRQPPLGEQPQGIASPQALQRIMGRAKLKHGLGESRLSPSQFKGGGFKSVQVP